MTAAGLPDLVRDPASPRSRGAALALALVGGPLGLHRFYVGRKGSGIAMLLTLGGLGVWWLYDIVTIAAGDFRDVAGRRLRRWELDDEPGGWGPGAVDELVERLDRMERELTELAERLDFAERLLAQRGPQERLPDR